VRGIGLMITDYQYDWPQLVEISEILFGHTDYQVLTRGWIIDID